MPKYEEIANILRERIKNQEYPPDSLLPNQTDLVKEFSVSRMTIKKAINILTMEGLIYSQRGAGTKVLNHPFWNKEASPANEYHGLTKYLSNEERDLKSQVIEFSVEFPDELLQERLTIDAHQPVYKIIRLRLVDGEPYILEHTFMPTDLVPGLSEEILYHSIYSYMKDELQLKFAGAFRNIQADRPDEYDQKYLGCRPTDPVLEVEQVVYLTGGRSVEYSRSRNRFDQRGYSLLDILE